MPHLVAQLTHCHLQELIDWQKVFIDQIRILGIDRYVDNDIRLDTIRKGQTILFTLKFQWEHSFCNSYVIGIKKSYLLITKSCKIMYIYAFKEYYWHNYGLQNVL